MKTQPTNERVEKGVEEYRNINMPSELLAILGNSRITIAQADKIDDFVTDWLRTTLTTLLTDCEVRVRAEYHTELCRVIEGDGNKLRENSLISPLESYRLGDQIYGYNQAINRIKTLSAEIATK